MGALAVAIIITFLLIILGFRGRIAVAIRDRGLHFLEPREGWSRSALIWFKALGIPFFILAFMATLFQTIPTDVYLVTIAATEGTKITVPVESQHIPGLQPRLHPASVAELTEQWPDLSAEERKTSTLNLFPELPDDTLVTYKPAGSEIFKEAAWGDLTTGDRKRVADIMTAPDTELDLKAYLPGQMTQSEQGF